MHPALVPCPACDRHVLATEATCPFCAAALPGDLARRAVPPAPRRLGRAAALAFGVLALSASDCGARTDLPGSANGGAAGSGGGNGAGAGGSGGSVSNGGDNGYGGYAALYGGFPFPPPAMDDAGDGSPPSDAGHIVPVPTYGSPPRME